MLPITYQGKERPGIKFEVHKSEVLFKLETVAVLTTATNHLAYLQGMRIQIVQCQICTKGVKGVAVRRGGVGE